LDRRHCPGCAVGRSGSRQSAVAVFGDIGPATMNAKYRPDAAARDGPLPGKLTWAHRAMKDTLRIGLCSWILDDGNYEDFRCGVSASFALEFYPLAGLSLADPTLEGVASLKNAYDSYYWLEGTVVHV
jgi:hypothetical protein